MKATNWYAGVFHDMGDIGLFSGDRTLARSRLSEALRLFGEAGDRPGAVACLGSLAALAALEGDATRAVTLWSAAQAIRAATGTPIPPLRFEDYRQRVDAVRDQLGDYELATAIRLGSGMSFNQALEYALAGTQTSDFYEKSDV
jgi:hypothetical protein